MERSRLVRAFAALVLVLAQVALGLPHRMVIAQPAPTHASIPAGGGHGNCHDGNAPASHNAPMPPCGSCPSSMPGTQGGACLDMASCGPASALAGGPPLTALATTDELAYPPALSAPAAHDFIPDPPPPRA